MKNQLACMLAIAVCAFSVETLAQVGIGTDAPNTKAVLELKSPNNNQGFLVPRLTTAQRTATTFTSTLSVAEKGLLVFDTDTNKFYYWNGTAWAIIEDSVGTDSQTLTFASPTLSISGGNAVNLSAINTDGQTLTFTPASGLLAISGGNNVTISGTAPGGAAGGDLTGNYPNPTIANNAITSAKIIDGTIATADLANASVSAAKLANTTVIANTYGTATQVPQLTVDAQGRITGVTNVTITGIAPTGAAGGDLTGTYPNPTIAANAISSAEITDGSIATADLANASVTPAKLSNTTVVPNTYGTATQVPQLTVDAQGRITGVTNTAITGISPSGTAGGDLTGTYPNPTIAANAISSAEITDGAVATIDLADGSITSAKIVDGAVATADLANASVTALKLANTTVAAGTYGTATQVPQFTVDAQGRITGVTPTTIAVTASGAASGDLTGAYPAPTVAATAGNNIVTAINNASTTGTINANRLNTGVVLDTEAPAAGDITGNFSTGLQINTNAVGTTEIANGAVTAAKLAATGVTAGTYGSSTIVPRITVDAQGRITGVTNQTVGSSSQDLQAVLATGNNAGNSEAVNFNAIGIGTDKPMANLHVVGSQIVNQVIVQDDYDLKPTDYSIFVPNTAKPLSIRLPPIEGDPNYIGRVIIIRTMNTQTVRVLADVDAKDFIDFFGTQYDMAQFGNADHNTRFHTFTCIATKLSGGNRWIIVSGLKGQL